MDLFEQTLLTFAIGFGLLWCGATLATIRNRKLNIENQVAALVGLINILVEEKLLDPDLAMKALADRYGIKLQYAKPKNNGNTETPSNRK